MKTATRISPILLQMFLNAHLPVPKPAPVETPTETTQPKALYEIKVDGETTWSKLCTYEEACMERDLCIECHYANHVIQLFEDGRPHIATTGTNDEQFVETTE